VVIPVIFTYMDSFQGQIFQLMRGGKQRQDKSFGTKHSQEKSGLGNREKSQSKLPVHK
jgi:hypothetical protein